MSTSNHDLAIGMLNGYIESLIDPQCAPIAVKASANTAILIFRTLSIISADEDAKYTERLLRTFDIRQGRAS